VRLWRGQIEVPAAVITAAVALVTSAITGIVTFTVAEARATAEFRADVAAHSRKLDRLDGLPVEDLKKLPARFEVYVAAAEMQAKAAASQALTVAKMERMLAAGVRPASGKR
jgi:hypothetical protein